MHDAVMGWLATIRAGWPVVFLNRDVLEAGSLNVNGSPRGFFAGGTYTGVDIQPGPGVDVVGLAHEHVGLYDTIISTEMLEHDPYWVETLRRMAGVLLRPHGSLILTVAAPGRPPHGDYGPEPDYYRPLAAGDILPIVHDVARFAFEYVERNDAHRDVYLFLHDKQRRPK